MVIRRSVQLSRELEVRFEDASHVAHITLDYYGTKAPTSAKKKPEVVTSSDGGVGGGTKGYWSVMEMYMYTL